jgi:hypothetical protein
MIDRNTRVIDLKVGDLEDIFANSEKKSRDRNVTTEELAKELNCAESQIGIYGRAGMYEAQGCRIKKNCWNLLKCEEWVATKYQEILKKTRKPKV